MSRIIRIDFRSGILLCFACLFLQKGIVNAQEFTSPRATALGSYVAVSDDVFGLDWNASAMAFSPSDLQVAFTNRDFSESIVNFGLFIRFRKRHTIAIRKTPDFQVFAGFRKHPEPEKIEDVTPYDLLFSLVHEQSWALGYAFRLSSRLSLGFDAKQHKYSNNLRSSSRFWSLSFGATYFLNDRLWVGLVSRNTFAAHYKEHRDRIILRFPDAPDVTVFPVDFDALPYLIAKPEWRLDLGVAARPLTNLLFSFDFYSEGGFGAGFEWEALKGFYLRQALSHKNDGLFEPQKVFAVASGIGLFYGAARFDLTLYISKGERDSAFQRSSFGQFEIQPSQSDHIFLISLLFFVK